MKVLCKIFYGLGLSNEVYFSGGSEIPSQLLLNELFGKRETAGHSPPRNNSLSFGLEPHFSPKPRRIKEISKGDISSSIEEHSMSPESPHMD
jgi:hypothetical protein